MEQDINNVENLGSVKYYQYACGNIDDSKEKYDAFIEKLKCLEGVTSIEKARKIAKDFLPLDREKTYLTIGNAKCVIISRNDVFRVCVDSDDEYICYNIIRKNDEQE